MKTLDTFAHNRWLAFSLDVMSATCRATASARPSPFPGAIPRIKGAEAPAAQTRSGPHARRSACSRSQS
jgi:hypothetical protein